MGWPKGKPRNNAIQSFLSMVQKTNSCWIWTGHIDKDGYGYFRRNGAHRFSVENLGGKTIPPGMQVDHLCRNRKCVNPDHLEVVTPKINTLRGESIQSLNHQKTHCKRGHLFDGSNTYYHAGRRICKACMNMHKRNYQMKNSNHMALRQGDVLLKPATIPADAKRITVRPIALGERTGHHHSLMSNVAERPIEDLVEMYEKDGQTFVRVLGEPESVSLVHQQHKAAHLVAAEYVYVPQVENSDWGTRQVID